MRISVVNGVCVEHDAISETVRGSIQALSRHFGSSVEVRLFTHANQFRDCHATIVDGVGGMIIDEYFMTSDVIMYHFGVTYDMFNALLIGNGKAKQIVRFHNITPKVFMPTSSHAIIDKSLQQIALIDQADAILADSEFNKNDLVKIGIDADRIEVSPLYVKFETPPRALASRAKDDPVRFLYVGRFVQSKGVIDLVNALAMIAETKPFEFRVTLAGNVNFSDPNYLEALRSRISQTGLSSRVFLEGSVGHDRLQELYNEADVFVMPSSHEGFCVPVLEALHAGCIPVVSTAGNLPFLVGKLGRQFPPGDASALATALIEVGQQLTGSDQETLSLAGPSITRRAYLEKVDQLLSEHTFDAFARRLVQSVKRVLENPASPRANRV